MKKIILDFIRLRDMAVERVTWYANEKGEKWCEKKPHQPSHEELHGMLNHHRGALEFVLPITPNVWVK